MWKKYMIPGIKYPDPDWTEIFIPDPTRTCPDPGPISIRSSLGKLGVLGYPAGLYSEYAKNLEVRKKVKLGI